MGKAKKRSFALGINKQIPSITREQAVEKAVKIIENRQEVLELISLFGLSAEELLEAGATYEDVMSLGELVQ